eukprot:g20900.t1
MVHAKVDPPNHEEEPRSDAFDLEQDEHYIRRWRHLVGWNNHAANNSELAWWMVVYKWVAIRRSPSLEGQIVSGLSRGDPIFCVSMEGAWIRIDLSKVPPASSGEDTQKAEACELHSSFLPWAYLRTATSNGTSVALDEASLAGCQHLVFGTSAHSGTMDHMVRSCQCQVLSRGVMPRRRHGGVKPLIRTCRSQARQLLEGHFEGGCAVFQAKGLDHQEPQSIYFLAHYNFCDHLLFYEDGHFQHGSDFAFGGSDGHGNWRLEGEERGGEW